jgi:hypothetical protein
MYVCVRDTRGQFSICFYDFPIRFKNCSFCVALNTLQFSSLFFFLITIHFTTVIPDIQSFHIDMNYIIDSIMWSKYEMLVLNIYFAFNLLQIGMKRTTLRPRHMHFRKVMPDLFYHWSYSIYVQLLYHSLA